jgi:hypothetical protein
MTKYEDGKERVLENNLSVGGGGNSRLKRTKCCTWKKRRRGTQHLEKIPHGFFKALLAISLSGSWTKL